MHNVTYLNHSGFLVETENYYLLFDYYSQNKRYTLGDLKKFKEKTWIIFVSHAHNDHFDEEILKFQGKLKPLGYVLSSDITTKLVPNMESISVTPDNSYRFMGADISTLRSNDEGVAFLVSVDGLVIYHGGDLNWWHWNGESKEFNNDIAEQYCSEIDKLLNKSIDVAMLPVDLRLEDKYIWGLDYFMKNISAKQVFPMHFWKKFEVSDMLKNNPVTESYRSNLVSISHENEEFTFE